MPTFQIFFNARKINFKKRSYAEVNFISPFFIIKSGLKTKLAVKTELHCVFFSPCHWVTGNNMRGRRQSRGLLVME